MIHNYAQLIRYDQFLYKSPGNPSDSPGDPVIIKLMLFKKLSAYIFESADRPAYHLRKINRIEQHFQGIVKWFRVVRREDLWFLHVT